MSFDLSVQAYRVPSDLRADWPFAGLPSPLRLSTVPARGSRKERFRLRGEPASKPSRLSGADG